MRENVDDKAVVVKKARIDWLDYYKGIGIFLVVLGHCFLPSKLRGIIYSFHMPLFFLAGGLTLNPQRYANIKEFLKKKAVGLLIPYVILNLYTLPSWIYFSKIHGNSEVTLSTLLYGIIYGNNDKVPLLCGPSWFIPALFLAEVTFYIMYRLCKGKTEAMIAFAMALGVMGYTESVARNGVIRPWHLASVPMAVIFVTVGYMFAQAYKEDGYQKIKEQVSWRWIFGLAIAGACTAYMNGGVSYGGNNYKSMTLALITALSLNFAVLFFCMKIPKSRLLSFAGQASMVMLFLHKTILFGIRMKWPATRDNYIASAKGIILLFAILIPSSYIIHRFFPFLVGKKSDKKVNYIGCVIFTVFTIAMCVKYML